MAVSELDWRQGGRQLAVLEHVVPPGDDPWEVHLIGGAEERPVVLRYLRFLLRSETEGEHEVQVWGANDDPFLVCDVTFRGGWGFLRPDIVVPGESITVFSSVALSEVLLGVER